MGLARQAGLPVVVVGDIDRGGVLASMYGTVALLEPADQALLAGWVVNKFRGDVALLRPGLESLERLTGRPVLGVLPWLDGVWVDSEDALAVAGWSAAARGDGATLRVAVVRFPRVSNATDVDALACESRRVRDGDRRPRPGRGRRCARASRKPFHRGGPGLAARAGSGERCRRRGSARCPPRSPSTRRSGSGDPAGRGGAFENGGFRRAWLVEAARQAGVDWRPATDAPGFAAQRERMVDSLADAVEEHLDTAALCRLIEGGAPAGLPVVPGQT